jgi:CelD/BcsL family acetyltransferase involved in cellulose biosynthesis
VILKSIFLMQTPQKNFNKSPIETKVFQGNHAIEVLEKSNFLIEWSYLVENSVIQSVFQEPSFVIPWYKIHLNNYNPIVLTVTAEGRLVGLLTLAQKLDIQTGKKSLRLEGAGTFHALYQTWLVLPEYQTEFWELGIKGLLDLFPKVFINLKSLADKTLIENLKSQTDFSKISVIEQHLNPILSYEKDDFKSILNKRHFRSKSNRLKRAGTVKFEKLTSKESLIDAFKDIEVYHDLRQGAAFNKVPFGNDSTQREIFLDWFDRGILHVTVLSLDNEFLAAVIIINDNNRTAHLAGLITYSPRHAKLSPGLVHLYYLAQKLFNESFQKLKLSPGYDTYKERFCNDQELVYEILISNRLIEILKRKFRKIFRKIILRFGIRPMELDVLIDKFIYKIKNRFRHVSKNFIGNETKYNEKLHQWIKRIVLEEELNKFNFNKNKISDLLLVDDKSFEVCRWEFLVDALRRLENDQNFITQTKNNQLLVCIWYDTLKNYNEEKYMDSFNIIKIYKSLNFKNSIMK